MTSHDRHARAALDNSYLIPLGLFLILSGCGGGGGGGGSTASPAPVVYTGNQSAAVITADSARTLAAAVIGAGSVSVIVAGIKVQQAQPLPTSGPVVLAPRLNRILREALDRMAPRARSANEAISGLNVQETVPCQVSGTVTFSGTLSDSTGTGTLSVTFNSCTVSNSVLDGAATFKIDAFDQVSSFFTDTTTSFSTLQVKTLTTISFPGFQVGAVVQDVTASGSLRSLVTIATNREQLSGNLVTRDNASGTLQKADNLALAIDYNYVLSPSYYNLSVSSARVFDSVLGFVDAATASPWLFPTLDQIFPSSGGALTLTGAQNAHVAVTPVSATQVKLELDLDGNGIFELSSTMLWTGIKPPAVNTAPVANAGSSRAVPKGLPVTLDGSGSFDAESDFLRFQWTLAQKPNGSAAQLTGATNVRPTLTLDIAGEYIVNLVVNDDKLSSAGASITLNAFNIAPVAKVDPLFLGYNGVQVPLDGSGSSDGNNDPLTFTWSLTLKPQGSSAALSDTHSATPTFTPDLIGIYRFSLTVNDGTVDSQAVAVTGYAVTKVALTPQRQVPGDHPTIQAAIDAASPGDVIAVAPGTYTGNLRFNGRNVTLQSTDGPSRTIIKGVGDTAVDIGPNGAIIGFTVRDGIASFGGGMATHGVGTVIKNNIFTANTQGVGGFGAAIAGNAASPLIDANVFRGNSCQNDNQFLTGVIAFVNGSSPVITNNIIQDNPCRAINITLPTGLALQMINNTIVSNRTGIRVNRFMSTAQVYRNNVIVGNDLGFDVDGGTDADNPVWENNLVFGNGTNYQNTADKTGVAGNISADPLFVDQAAGIYFPKAGSPLIDQGTATGAPSADFFGRSRPIDGNGDSSAVPDIGAFEFQP